MKLEEVESAIGYTFKDEKLLKRALTLASASEENNQLLEFFGDAILEFIVSERIFGEGGSEGTLTERRKNLVSDDALEPVSLKLGFDKFLIRGKRDVFNKKAIPSAYEAVTAAIYLDGGMEAAKDFVLSTLDFSAQKIEQNPISELQEILQDIKQPLPDYDKGCEEIGTPQKPRFRLTIHVFDKDFTVESDKKKKEGGAEQLAAKAALEYYKNNKQP